MVIGHSAGIGRLDCHAIADITEIALGEATLLAPG